MVTWQHPIGSDVHKSGVVNHVRHISLEPHPVRRLKGVLLSYFFKVGLVPIVTFLIGVNLYDHHGRVARPNRRQLFQVFTKIDLLLRDLFGEVRHLFGRLELHRNYRGNFRHRFLLNRKNYRI